MFSSELGLNAYFIIPFLLFYSIIFSVASFSERIFIFNNFNNKNINFNNFMLII